MRRVRRGRTLKIISFFTVNFLDTASRTPYIGPVNARSAPAAASRRPKEANEETGGNLPAFRPAAADRLSDPPSRAPPIAPPGLDGRTPSGSTLRFRRAVLPGDAASGVERRSRSAGRLENFLSRLFLRTPEGRLSSDSKGLAQRRAKKKAQERPVCPIRHTVPKNGGGDGENTGTNDQKRKGRSCPPFCRAIL